MTGPTIDEPRFVLLEAETTRCRYTNTFLFRDRMWSGAVRVPSVANGRHIHRPSTVIDEVEDSVVAAPREPSRIERPHQRLSDSSRIVEQWAGDESMGCRRDLGGKHLSERPCCGPGDPEPVGLIDHFLDGRRPASRIVSASSASSMPSPRSSASTPSRWPRSSWESPSTAIVSCRAS